MSNTAVQRAVADMKLAGINPILAAGNSASTPTGSMATMQASRSEPFTGNTDVLSPAVNSAIQARRLRMELESQQANIDKMKSETFLNDNLGAKTVVDRANALQNLEILKANTSSARSKAVLDAMNTSSAAVVNKWDTSGFGKFFTVFERMVDAISPVGGSAKSISTIGR